MRKVFLTLAVAAAITLTACGSHATDSQADGTEGNDTTEAVMPAEVPATPGLARKLVEENTFIDIDLRKIADRVGEARFNTSKIDITLTDDLAKAKAATYRIYRHITVTDDAYVYDNTPARELNITDDMLKCFLQNIDDNNAVFKKWKEKDLDFEIPPIDDAFMQELLK